MYTAFTKILFTFAAIHKARRIAGSAHSGKYSLTQVTTKKHTPSWAKYLKYQLGRVFLALFTFMPQLATTAFAINRTYAKKDFAIAAVCPRLLAPHISTCR